MKTLTDKIKALIISLALPIMVLMPQAVALAAPGISVKAQQDIVTAGDTIEIVLTLKGGGMAVAEGLFSYDPALLTYEKSEGGAYDGFINMVSASKGGADTLTARLYFLAAQSGEVKVDFTIEKVLSYSGADLGGAQASITIDVLQPTPTPTPIPISYALEGVPAQNVFGATQSLYVWKSLENVTVPSRYSEVIMQYHGQDVAAAVTDDESAPVLMYLSNDVGDEGAYYIYEQDKDRFYLYQTLSTVSKTYIILQPDSENPIPEKFTETTLLIGEREYPAFLHQDIKDEGVYIIFARNPDGEKGFYTYNTKDESFMRYAVLPMPPVLTTADLDNAIPSLDNQQESGDDIPKNTGEVVLSSFMFLALCGACILMFIAFIGLIILFSGNKRKKRRRTSPVKGGSSVNHKQDIGQ